MEPEDPYALQYQTVEEADAALEEEMKQWNLAGLNMGQLQIGGLSSMLLDHSSRIQATINLLIMKGLLTEDEVNLQYKTILCNNMKALREAQGEQERAQIRARIISAAHLPVNGLKPPWEA